MATLTPFGVALRKIRVEKQLRLFDLAEKLGKSTAMLSAVETGRKPIPDGFVVQVSRALDLSSTQVRELNSAQVQTRKEVRVDHLRGDQREFISALARRLEDLPQNVIDDLKKKYLKAGAGEVPFQRQRRGMLVPAMSIAAIEKISKRIRSLFCEPNEYAVPIIEILEFEVHKIVPEFVFDVRDAEDIDGDEGRMIMGKHLLILRRDVYDRACRGEARDRFTACHELGHYLMHHHLEPTLARMRGDEDPVYRDAEWQADLFAGTLMMTREHANELVGPEQAAARCLMSLHAAKVTFSKYK
jgi:Zn-dependent peptidase ImmA (M78 family)/transcriptional regulator with XRE-family HTH domain